MPSVHGGTLDDRQNVSLHALPAHIRTVPALAAGDLIDLIQKNNAAGFHSLERYPDHGFDISPYAVWETPDPGWWVPRGYACVRADFTGVNIFLEIRKPYET